MKKRIVRWLAIHMIAAVLLGACTVLLYPHAKRIRQDIRSQQAAQELAQMQDLSAFADHPTVVPDGDAWYTKSHLVYHACGGIDGLAYTNSVEALENTLNRGGRLIEADFGYTTDGTLVCVHSWDDITTENLPVSLQEFESTPVCGRYTPMTAETLLDYMERYEDMYLIIDDKEEDPLAVVRELIALCGENPDIIDRFVVQLYDGGVKAQMQEMYPFGDDQFLFSAYKLGPEKHAEIMGICYDENICVLTIADGAWDEATVRAFAEKGFILFNHTVNRLDHARLFAAQGVYGFYTDFLPETDFPIAK